MARLISAAMTVSVFFLASIANSAGDSAQDPNGPQVAKSITNDTDARDLKATGELLRKALNAVYKELPSHSREIPGRPTSRDISDTVIKFLPTGISLDDAESILRFAGFSIRPMDLREGDGSRVPLLAKAYIYPFEKHWLYTYYSSIGVELLQDGNDKRDKVGRIRAEVVMPES